MAENRKKPRWGVRLVVAVAVLAGGGYAILFAIRPVAIVAAAHRGRAIDSVPGSVEVQAEFVSEIKSEVGGRIISSILDPGLKVKKGDVLVQIDTGDADLEIDRIKNEIEAARKKVDLGSPARAEAANMEDTIANHDHMVKAGSYSAGDLEKERRLLQQARKRIELDEVNLKLDLETDENELRTKERERAKMTIVAPVDGVISVVELNARTGDLIGRDTAIATLISSSRTVEARISEENFAGIRVGQDASVTFLGYGQKLFKAKVMKVLPTANAETQRYLVHLGVDVPLEMLVPGLTGEVAIMIGSRDAATIIPRRALRGNEVLVVNDDTVEVRKIRLGYVSMNDVEVLEGLREGDQVVVEDLDQFRPGSHVRVRPVK
ncbi:MAG TPA: efflux RND transporter periplasmic adaptor subunit [Candidatus Didemnitutus sp.]|jgi:RND family efflux transporter MFP subunit